MKAVVKIGLNDCGVKSRYLGPSGGTASLFALANARDQNAEYGNGPPKIILKCLRKRTWALRRFRSINQSINHSITQSIHYLINQSINQSLNQPQINYLI